MDQQTNENHDVPWGGKRTGAGRKAPPDGKLELLSVRVRSVTLRKLQAEADRRGVSLREVVDELAKELPEVDQ
ncbi:MAG TPA: hypothetical protein VE641_10520 [Chthoniobacterales bacterium]|jgi:hypothetical protein|nr:hypothetical protein [Chthoniobacterales bacterium]